MSGDRTGGRLVVPKEQRDLLLERILRNLARLDDLCFAVRKGESEKAERLGHHLWQELALVTNDLGWGDRRGERCIEVSTSPLIVRGVLERLRAEAEALDADIDLRDPAAENRELIAACNQLLESFEDQQPQGKPWGAGAPPFGARTDDQIAQKEVLRLLLRSHPMGLRQKEFRESISSEFRLSLASVDRAVRELRHLDLIAPGRSGLAATKGANRISELWGDLSELE